MTNTHSEISKPAIPALDDARRALMENNVKLAYYMASRYAGDSRTRVEDYTGIAMVALAKSCINFDPSKGEFGRYAAKCIRGELTRAYGKDKKSDAFTSFDDQLDDGSTLHEIISTDPHDVAILPLIDKHTKETMERLVRQLDAREQRVVIAMYWENLSLRAIGVELGISHTYVAKAHTSALKRLQVLAKSCI